jgi:phosphonoacetaldehyde hydrolase
MAKKASFRYKGKIKGIIFDTVGVLVDCGCLHHNKAIANIFKMRNIELKESLIRNFNGLTLKDQLKKIVTDRRVLNDWKKIYGNKPNDEDLAMLLQDLINRIAASIPEKDYIIDSYKKKFNKLNNKGYKIALTCEYPPALASLIFDKLQKDGFKFSQSITINDTMVGAPFPWMCYMSAIKLNVFPLNAIIRVGDSPYNIEEGINANMWTAGVVNTGNLIGLSKDEMRRKGVDKLHKKVKSAYKKFKKKGAHYVIDSINDISWVIDDINSNLLKTKK